MSRRARRFFYITSLYAFERQINTDVSDDQLLDQVTELNKRFQLTQCDQRALLLPLFTYTFIWRKLQTRDIQKNRHCRRQGDLNIVDHVIECSPRWIRYEYTQMYDDTLTVLQEIPNRTINIDERKQPPKDYAVTA